MFHILHSNTGDKICNAYYYHKLKNFSYLFSATHAFHAVYMLITFGGLKLYICCFLWDLECTFVVCAVFWLKLCVQKCNACYFGNILYVMVVHTHDMGCNKIKHSSFWLRAAKLSVTDSGNMKDIIFPILVILLLLFNIVDATYLLFQTSKETYYPFFL